MLSRLSGRVGTEVKWRIKRIDLDLNLCLRPAFPPNYLASMANGHIGHSSKATYGRKSILHNLAMHSLTLTALRQVALKPKESDDCLEDHSGDGDKSGSARNCDCKLATTAAESVVAEKRRLEQHHRLEQRSAEQSCGAGGNDGKEQPATVPTNRFRIHHSDILERLVCCGIAFPMN